MFRKPSPPKVWVRFRSSNGCPTSSPPSHPLRKHERNLRPGNISISCCLKLFCSAGHLKEKKENDNNNLNVPVYEHSLGALLSYIMRPAVVLNYNTRLFPLFSKAVKLLPLFTGVSLSESFGYRVSGVFDYRLYPCLIRYNEMLGHFDG